MNRQAAVLAADSAVTYGGGADPVVTLEAEKILPLTDSIALMVYSRGDVLGRSWQHIAHSFTKHIGNTEYESVSDCATAFFAFLDHNRHLFPESEERAEFSELIRLAFLTVLNHARAMRSYPGSPHTSDDDAFHAAIDLYRAHLAHDEGGTPRAPVSSLQALTRERFYSTYGTLIDSIITDALGEFGAQPDVRDKLFDFAYLLVTMPAFLEPYAGLVFAGFGSADIFPVYDHFYASILVDGVLKRAHDETTRVGVEDGPNAFVRTFAQADMTHAFLRGVHPMMFDMMISMNMVTNEIAAEQALASANVPAERATEILQGMQGNTLPALSMEFIRGAQAVSQHEFIDPFIAVVAASGKKQMAETAKSLVELNILKSDLHQVQTGVGGAVDVVMISRTAGVEWYAHKA